MNRILSVFSVILIMALIAWAAYLRVPFVQEKMASLTEDDFNDSNIYTDLEGVSKRLEREILNGSDSFTVYLKGMDIDSITKLNEGKDGIFGSGETYRQVGAVGDTYKKVTITIKKTANYFVYDAYVNGNPVPETEKKANVLYMQVKQILDTQIHDGMTDYEKELALHDYLVTNCCYSEETVQSPDSDIYRAYGALVNHDAVCNGYAEALQLLFLCCGIHSEFVIGKADGVDHAWNLVELDGKWYHLDATWDDPKPDQGKDTLHAYFNVSDEIMGKSHTWERGDYPLADSMDYNYYIKEGLYFKNFDTYKTSAYAAMVTGGNARYEAVIEDYQENEDDMQFVFENNYRYNRVSWQAFSEGMYNVLVLKAE